MKVTGVIAEYNPFHNGHEYQLKELKKQTGSDYLIVAMSGDFLQRGVPAILDKHTRAKMALLNGADLVLELPAVWATASAEYFATGGVSLLGATGVVNTIGYGVESENAALRKELCKLLSSAPKSYDEKLLSYQKEGLSFPLSRASALCTLLPDFTMEEVTLFLAKPNNILALEYEKAIAKWNQAAGFPIESCALLRRGDNYHDAEAHSVFASATAIRNLLQEGRDITPFVPASVAAVLEINRNNFIFPEDISALLYERLLVYKDMGYEGFADCSAALSNKIAASIYAFRSFSQFCEYLKSKDLTYTRISRVLLHILLDIKKEDYNRKTPLDQPPYLRVLGFRNEAKDLLKEIKKEASAPLITKVADASQILSPSDYAFFKKDLFAADLYRGLHFPCSADQLLKNEFSQEIVIL